MKFKLFSALCLLGAIQAIAQTGSIKGTVVTSDGKPAEFVNIVLEKSGRGAVVNEAGIYAINKVPSGSYTLVASFTGLMTQKAQVTVTSGETSTINFELLEDKRQLQEVIVRGQSRLVNKESDMVARMSLKNLENPQVYNVVGKELMKQQSVIALTDAFSNAAGVTPVLWPSGGIAALSRGFGTDINARNGLSSNQGRSSADIANIERIEFIKGPSGALFGGIASSFGGVVNLVTKKPFETFKGSVDISGGSFSLGRANVDVNTPLNQDKSLLLRTNAAIQRQDSYNERGFYNSALFAPSLLYKASDRLTVLVDAEIYSVNSTRPDYVSISESSGIRSYADIPLDYRKSFMDNDLDAKLNNTKFFAEAKYKINNRWTSSTNFSYLYGKVEHSYQAWLNWANRDTVEIEVARYGPINNVVVNLQQNFNGTFETGLLKHNFLAGVNIEQQAGSGRSGSGGILRKLNPHQPYTKVDRLLADSALVPGTISYWGKINNIAYGAYVSDVISLSGRLKAMLSLRYEYYDAKTQGPWSVPYSQSSLSPKLGLVYQLVKDKVSVFGNYMNGYQNYGVIQQPNGSSFLAKPIYAVQYEAGIKAELLNRKMNATLSYYHIGIDNAIRYGNDGFGFQDGQQLSKGIELDFTANPSPGLTMVVGYGYNDNRIEGIESLKGKIANNSPQHIANYWINYQFQNGTLKNFGLGTGCNYVSKAYFDDTNLFVLPAYHIIGATAFYDNVKWRLGVKLNNLGNQRSWGMWGAPNPTRNFVANVTFKF